HGVAGRCGRSGCMAALRGRDGGDELAFAGRAVRRKRPSSCRSCLLGIASCPERPPDHARCHRGHQEARAGMTTNPSATVEPPITVVDYGVGNIGALLNMFDHLGIEARASNDSREIAFADKLVLPGVGAFDRAMSELRKRSLVAPLEEAVLHRRRPVLGVCLGMQLLARRSEEGNESGLGWVDADVKRIRLPAGSNLKVPHIGWMEIRPVGVSALFGPPGERFYFDHSYHVCCDRSGDVVALIDYGNELCCAVTSGNVHGVQFHPEKSHRFGMRLLQSF